MYTGYVSFRRENHSFGRGNLPFQRDLGRIRGVYGRRADTGIRLFRPYH